MGYISDQEIYDRLTRDMAVMNCLWCFRYFLRELEGVNSSADHVGPFLTDRLGELPMHKVRLWGDHSDVSKLCLRNENVHDWYWRSPSHWMKNSLAYRVLSVYQGIVLQQPELK
jgi:hypothetical protein